MPALPLETDSDLTSCGVFSSWPSAMTKLTGVLGHQEMLTSFSRVRATVLTFKSKSGQLGINSRRAL
jgi:hypothetical protein